MRFVRFFVVNAGRWICDLACVLYGNVNIYASRFEVDNWCDSDISQGVRFQRCFGVTFNYVAGRINRLFLDVGELSYNRFQVLSGFSSPSLVVYRIRLGRVVFMTCRLVSMRLCVFC